MPSLSALSRYWHTLRYLKPVQFYGRVWFRFARPKPDLRPAPAVRSPMGRWKRCARAPSMLGPARFCFLSVERELAAAADWNRADWPKLWLYNAHYFDDLAADAAEERAAWHRDLILRWVGENPPVEGNGWEPYPISLRLVNWVKWALAGNALEQAALQSFAVQARFLRRRLEIHLLGNHLWANAKALIFAGAFFEGAEADGWRAKGLAILRRELAEQILPDGGHFERSPMYHAILLEDVLDLLQLGEVYPDVFAPADLAQWRDAAQRMLRWLRAMSHPDGGIAFFNDAARGIAPAYADLAAYADAVAVSAEQAPLQHLEHLRDSGYVRFEAGPAVLMADVGEVGPDYLPGHAHADTLSFEFSLGDQRVLVNGGTSTYEADAMRLRQRGTAMHNTVQIDGADSSEVWSSFRVARRARPLDVSMGEGAEGLWLQAAHDGYRRLPGRPIHRRQWRLSSGQLRVIDTVEGRFGEAVARYRLHPSIEAQQTGAAGGVLALPNGDTAAWCVTGGTVELVSSTYHPRMGSSEPCQCLEVRLPGSRCEFNLRWQ